MEGNALTSGWVLHVIEVSHNFLLPIMISVFVLSVCYRIILFVLIRAQHKFVLEFEKRSQRFFTEDIPQGKATRIPSFWMLTKKMLDRTLHETFGLKRLYQRRKLDYISSLTDRVFMIEMGTQRICTDTLKHAKYLRKDGAEPKFVETAKTLFSTNPYFTRVFGIIPVNVSNDFINTLPGLFVIGGIFGTFLGILEGIPQLGAMDITNPEATKATMAIFLSKMSYSMMASIVGILCSVALTVVNTLLSPEALFYDLIDRFTMSMELLWNETETNEVLIESVDEKPAEAIEAKEPEKTKRAA